MGSAKRERKRARKAEAEKDAVVVHDEPVYVWRTGKRKPPPKVEVKQGDWWRLYGMTTPMPWLEPDEPDGGT